MRISRTAQRINFILGWDDENEIGKRYLDRFPIHQPSPNVYRLQDFLTEQTPKAEYKPETLRRLLDAVALAQAYEADASMLREQSQISNPAKIAAILRPDMENLKQEILIAIALDTKNNVVEKWTAPAGELKRADKVRKADVTAKEQIYKGSLNASIIHPREIYHFAIKNSAHSIVIAHNHPTGDPTPSPEDIRATRELEEAGKILKIQLLDHLIIGNEGRYISMKEEGYM